MASKTEKLIIINAKLIKFVINLLNLRKTIYNARNRDSRRDRIRQNNRSQ